MVKTLTKRHKASQSVIQHIKLIFYGENMDILEPLISKGNINIYESDLQSVIDEYINKLPSSEMILKSSCFQGLLEYIYKLLLKDIIKRDNDYNYDYVVLNTIFNNIYVPLCNIYSMTPTMIMFCCNLCHLDFNYIKDIKKGYTRNGHKIDNRIVEIINGWSNKSESSLISKVIEHNSIGSIFALKAKFNYSDNQPFQLQIQQTETHKTRDEIRQKYSNAFLPSDNELELSDNLNEDII